MPEETKAYLTRIPVELWAKVEAMADQNYTTVNSIIRQALAEKWLRHMQSINSTLPVETEPTETQTA